MGFFGVRGSNDWSADQRPKNWRQSILYLFPNGRVPITAIQSMMKSESTNDPEFNWWTKVLATQSAAVTGVYTDSGLTTAYVSGATAGTTLYFKTSAADESHFRTGHQVLCRVSTDLTADVVGKVTSVVSAGASSYVAVKLLEADDNSTLATPKDLSDADTLKINGNINEEGGITPDAISYDPVKYFNYTQIFRTPLSMTRTAMKTKLRTGDQYRQAKEEALMYHGIEMEWSSLTGIKTESIGTGGKPERTTQGIVPFLRANNPSNIVDYTLDTNYSAQTWLAGGDDWLLDIMEILYRYDDGNDSDYIMLAGSGTLKALERLVRNKGTFEITPGQNVGFGVKLRSWETSFGSVQIKTHPLFSYDPAMRNTAIFYKPKNMVYRYIDDTQFYGQQNKNYGFTTSGKRIDGLNEEYLTEAGYEFHHPQSFMFAKGFGSTNVV